MQGVNPCHMQDFLSRWISWGQQMTLPCLGPSEWQPALKQIDYTSQSSDTHKPTEGRPPPPPGHWSRSETE